MNQNFNRFVSSLVGTMVEGALLKKKMDQIYDGSLSEQFRCIISGASSTGKSTLMEKLMINQNRIYPYEFENIIFLYGVETASLANLKKYFGKKLQAFDHIPENLPELCSRKNHNLLVLDDLDDAAFSSETIAFCFTKWSHHKNFCILVSTQNIFSGGTKRLTLIRNATHIILFPNYLDNTVPRLIAQKVLPGKTQAFMKIYEKATSTPYGYLAIFGNSPNILKFRTDITCPVQKIFILEEV